MRISGAKLNGYTGFSLVELLVVIAIVSILAAIAIPAYDGYLQKGHRADATTMLIRVRLAQERYRAENPSYATQLSQLGFSADSIPSDGGYYTVSVVSANSSQYELQAVPVEGSTQANDACGRFRLTQNWPNDLTDAERTCWGQ